jgi:hypothetical protein
MMRKPFVALAVGAILTVAVFAAPSATKMSTVTVGDFAAKVAVALGYDAQDQKAAVKSLQKRGVKMTADLGAPLTDGEVARMMADLGVRVSTPTDADAFVTPAKANALIGTIGMQAASIPVIETTPPPPTQCLSSVDRGTCVDCCKAASGLTGKFCGRYCHSNVPPPISPEEPTP